MHSWRRSPHWSVSLIGGSVPKELEVLGIREFRPILLDPYRLIYRVIASKVVVLAIAYGRRDMQALLERRLLGR